MADFGIGDPNDALATSTSGRWSLVALGKGIYGKLTTIAASTVASLGQKTMANSSPVVIASDQTPVEVYVKGSVGGALAWVGAAIDGDGASTPTVWTKAQMAAYNGSTYDRFRNNYENTQFSSAARTASAQSADEVNYNWRGVVVCLDVTVIGAGSITLTIAGKSVRAAKYRNILTSAAVTTVSTNYYTVYPGVTAAANIAASAPLERIWRIEMTHSTADPITYTVSANYIL